MEGLVFPPGRFDSLPGLVTSVTVYVCDFRARVPAAAEKCSVWLKINNFRERGYGIMPSVIDAAPPSPAALVRR
jgi:hypothetical protein